VAPRGGRLLDADGARLRRDVEHDAVPAAEYRRAVRSFAGMSSLDVWYTRLDVDEINQRFGGNARTKETIRRDAAKAASKDSLRALGKLTRMVDGEPAFVNAPPVLSRLDDLVGPEEASRFMATAETLVRAYRASLPDDRRSSWSGTASSTSPARSSASAASGRGRGLR
jgi:hypothetical protein